MGQVKAWGMAIDEACEEVVSEKTSKEERFDAVAQILKAEGWPVTKKDIKMGFEKALDK